MKNSSCSQSLACKSETPIWEERGFLKEKHPLAKQRVDLYRRVLICNRDADSQGAATICEENISHADPMHAVSFVHESTL